MSSYFSITAILTQVDSVLHEVDISCDTRATGIEEFKAWEQSYFSRNRRIECIILHLNIGYTTKSKEKSISEGNRAKETQAERGNSPRRVREAGKARLLIAPT